MFSWWTTTVCHCLALLLQCISLIFVVHFLSAECKYFILVNSSLIPLIEWILPFSRWVCSLGGWLCFLWVSSQWLPNYRLNKMLSNYAFLDEPTCQFPSPVLASKLKLVMKIHKRYRFSDIIFFSTKKKHIWWEMMVIVPFNFKEKKGEIKAR